jgi:hypothetical protein
VRAGGIFSFGPVVLFFQCFGYCSLCILVIGQTMSSCFLYYLFIYAF